MEGRHAAPVGDARMTIVLLELHGKRHSLYNSLLENPPDGFTVAEGRDAANRLIRSLAGIENLPTILLRTINQVIPLSVVEPYLLSTVRRTNGFDIVFSAGHLVFGDVRWIVDLEFVTQLTGYSYPHFLRFRRLIERMFRAPNCRAVLSWTLVGVRTIRDNLDSEDWAEKVHRIPLAVPPQPVVPRPRTKDDSIRLLFVGSVNIPGQFELKGGMETISAYEKLSDQFDGLELTLRSDIPSAWRRKAEKLGNVRIIEKRMSRQEIQREFQSADIFIFPSYSTPGLVLLDAMSFGLPVVTTDVWANREMVTNDLTGFVVPESKKVPWVGKGIPGWGNRAFLRTLARPDPEVTRHVVSATSALIENAGLRNRMGREGRREVEDGVHSIRNRNALLRGIFEEASRR